MISRIEAYRYRCFEHLNLSLGPRHVFAGSNGAGKTTLLDIPALLGDLTSVTDISEAFFKNVKDRSKARAELPNELVHKGEGDTFILVLEARIPEEITQKHISIGPVKFRQDSNYANDTVRYELAIKLVENCLEVVDEHLLLFNDSIRSSKNNAGKTYLEFGKGIQGGRGDYDYVFPVIERNWRQKTKYRFEWLAKRNSNCIDFAVQENKTALSAMPADDQLFPAAFWFANYLKNGAHCYEPQWPAMKMASPLMQKDEFKLDGSSLPWQVLSLQENDKGSLEDWTETVQMALPLVDSIVAIHRVDDGSCYLKVSYKSGLEVTSSGLSHGTLHILALTILPYVKSAPNIITLEEPENGIHPKAIEAIMEALSFSDGNQFFVSTHSPIVLANTDVDQIITMHSNSRGSTDVLSGREHPALKEWKGEIDVGSLFAAGVLD